MTTAFSHVAPLPANDTVPADRIRPVRAHRTPSRHQAVEALVTIAVMAWFAAMLAGIADELHGVPPAPATQRAATRDLPVALPQASIRPGTSAHSTISLI